MTVEIDQFFGEIDGISEYNGIRSNMQSITNTTLVIQTGRTDCIISFSGIDNYCAVWEEFEIATVAENGVDIALCNVILK